MTSNENGLNYKVINLVESNNFYTKVISIQVHTTKLWFFENRLTPTHVWYGGWRCYSTRVGYFSQPLYHMTVGGITTVVWYDGCNIVLQDLKWVVYFWKIENRIMTPNLGPCTSDSPSFVAGDNMRGPCSWRWAVACFSFFRFSNPSMIGRWWCLLRRTTAADWCWLVRRTCFESPICQSRIRSSNARARVTMFWLAGWMFEHLVILLGLVIVSSSNFIDF
jgi:hypothetical protein